MQLATPRLRLRNYAANDVARVHLYASIPEFSKYELWGPNQLEDTEKFVQDMVEQSAQTIERYKFDLAIEWRESGLLIGGCGIRRESDMSAIANLGWAVHPGFQNRGVATEAAGALIDFGFGQLGLQVIYATCDARNVASARVMEKLGMKCVGLLRAERLQKGAWRDTLRYEVHPR